MTTIRINNPFELNYDPLSRELSLTHVESPSGRQIFVQFDSQATKALFDCLVAVALQVGGSIGAETIEKKSVQ